MHACARVTVLICLSVCDNSGGKGKFISKANRPSMQYRVHELSVSLVELLQGSSRGGVQGKLPPQSAQLPPQTTGASPPKICMPLM